MIQDHQKTLALLKIDDQNYTENIVLKEYGGKNGMSIPASF